MMKVRGAMEEVTEEQTNITEVRLKTQELQSACRQLREEMDAVLNPQAIEAGIRKPRKEADLLLFSEQLSDDDIRKMFLIPLSVNDIRNKYLPHFDLTQGVHSVDLRVRDTIGHVWIFKLTKTAGAWANPSLSASWLQFVGDKALYSVETT